MNRSDQVEEILVRETATVEEVFKVLDRTGLRTVLMIDDDARLSGVITDGDLRRAILGGATLSDTACSVANRQFISVRSETPDETAETYLTDRIVLVPIVDPDGRPVGFITRAPVGFIPSAEPVLGQRELAYVTDCVRSGWISSQGSYVSAFETQFAAYTGAPHALSVSNGTVALQLALSALGIGPGDEVIVPDLTFAASINAILHCGATPVIVDILDDELTIDPDEITKAITPATRAIMPVHLYGQMSRMDRIADIAKANDLVVVEDAAEALGSRWQGQHAGTLGDAGTFSFFGNKLITTGEGGMVVFKDTAVAERARMLRDHGMDPKQRYWHLEAGFNFRMTNMQAAVGVAQLERVETLLQAKLNLARQYTKRLSDLRPVLSLPTALPGTDHSFWCYVVFLNGPEAAEHTEALISFMREREIDVRPVFFPLHEMPPYRACKRQGDCPRTVDSAGRGIVLPSSPKLTEEKIDHVCEVLRAGLKALNLQTLIEKMSG